MSALGAALAVVVAGAPLAEVWPYGVKRLPDGALEYSYDLSALKAAPAPPDAMDLHGDEKVAAFLKGLPRSVKVKVAPGAPLDVAAGRGAEAGRLLSSFAAVSEEPLSTDAPLGDKRGAKLKAALDPEEPKVLLAAEAVAWAVHQLQLSALAAVEVDTEALRRELWSAVSERALKRFRAGQGDAREGAAALVARLAVASACLDPARVPAALKSDPDLGPHLETERIKLQASVELASPPAPWSWRPELTCAWLRGRALAQPFEESRGGTAAVLLYLELLAQDPKLAALAARIQSRQEKLVGAAPGHALSLWKEKARAGESIDALAAFLDSLPVDARTPPGLAPATETPFTHFLAQLHGAERRAAFDELASAVQDRRVAPGTDTWISAREAGAAPLCAFEGQSPVRLSGDWRDRLRATFAALHGAHLDARADDGGPLREQGERTELTVVLEVPPLVEVEPTPELYARLGVALEKLVEAFTAEKLQALTALLPDGQRGGPVVASAKAWIPRLKGLAALANPETASSKEAAEGRKLALAWRAEGAFTRDVREAFASPVAIPSERQHAAVVGVTRRELVAAFAKPPAITVVGPAAGLTTRPAEQRYLVPALVTVGGSAPPATKALERQALKALVDGAGRELVQIEGAFNEALKR